MPRILEGEPLNPPVTNATNTPIAAPAITAPLFSGAGQIGTKIETASAAGQQQPYIVINVPTGGEPKLHSVKTRKQLQQILRAIYNKTDQQFLYVARGDLANLFRVRGGLIVQFDNEEKLHVTSKPTKHELLRDGWLGD
jgi:hypothetical protein